MLLSLDSSAGTAVALLAPDGEVAGEWVSDDPRRHAEAVGPLLRSAVDAAGGPAALTAVAYGTGPGPFTGLRVGMAAARALADVLGLDALPVLSHDAVALEAGLPGPFVVVSDAKRRERYFTVYAAVVDGIPERRGEPRVADPSAVPALPVADAPARAAALGRVALARRAAGLPPGDPSPRYLRDPDVTPSAAPKRVS